MADEAVAEAYAQAGADIGRIRDLRPWLYSVAFRIARKEMKHQRRWTLVTRQAGPETASDPQEADADEILDLMQVLRSLTPLQRGALVLRGLYGYSSSEAADVLGVSGVAVRVHLHAARRRLRARLGEMEVP